MTLRHAMKYYHAMFGHPTTKIAKRYALDNESMIPDDDNDDE